MPNAERPNQAFPSQAALHDGIFRDVKTIVEANKIVMPDGRVQGQGEQGQQQADQPRGAACCGACRMGGANHLTCEVAGPGDSGKAETGEIGSFSPSRFSARINNTAANRCGISRASSQTSAA
jgi:hypothetical protein